MKKKQPYFIVFGNEKGGTGKSTLAMHVVIALAEKGKKVAILDLDSRQKTLCRYLENRKNYINGSESSLVQPFSQAIQTAKEPTLAESKQMDQENLQKSLNNLDEDTDIVVIDCPGNNTYLSQLAHALADTLITPINDSFVDFDLLGEVDGENYEVKKLSHYSEMVWEARKIRQIGGKLPLDWIVTRNRVSTLDSKNNQRVHEALTKLQKKIMFRYVPGLTERVIYRELFPKGLTLLDLKKVDDMGKIQTSHISARFELKNLVESIKIPETEQQ